MFFGYILSSKAYRIYIREYRQIEVSREAIFDETFTYEKSNDIPIELDEEDIPLFGKEEQDDKAPTNKEEEGPSEAIQPTIIPEETKRLA